ncbi:MAG: acyltransferase family protein [Tumebacillaceae bacterium]
MHHVSLMDETKHQGRYMAGLDGLRTLAVFAVIAYHLNLGWAPGGLLGVGVFFVLSGYLITDILVAQWDRRERLDLKEFWLRRARRLLPGVIFMLLLVVSWLTIVDPARLTSLRGEVWAALLYVSNWRYIFHHVSYFESFGPPSPLGHLWSLAVEEQFYLVWPLLLALGLRFVRRRGWLAGAVFAGAAMSALAMALLYVPGTDPSRVYYGTDTRAFALLIGAGLALVWPSRKLQAAISVRARWGLDLAGVAGLLGVLYMIWQTNQYDVSLYRGGLVLLSLATAVVIAVLAHPASRLGRVMGCAPLKWLGVRSYGIYLWHYPVIALTSPVVDTEGFDVTRALLQVAATIVLAALSWKYVEQPIRYGTAAGKAKSLSRVETNRQKRVFGYRVAATFAVVLFSVSCFGLSGLHAPDLATAAASSVPVSQPTQDTNNNEVPPSKPDTPPGPPAPITGEGITAIGDSVMLDAAPYLSKLLPGITVDGKIGRQMYEIPDVVKQLKVEGKLGSTIIIETGTNGPFTKDQMVELLDSLGSDKQIVLVNTRVPRPWEQVVNSTLSDVAASVPHTTLINWYEDSVGKDSYFYPDGVHLTPDGSEFYATILVNEVKSLQQ